MVAEEIVRRPSPYQTADFRFGNIEALVSQIAGIALTLPGGSGGGLTEQD